VYDLFGILSHDYKNEAKNYKLYFPEEVFNIAPKIYKGEQFNELPYVMMDYPRYFTKQNIFAIRSFFWWGNFFSLTLHLSGKYKADNLHRIWNNIKNNEFNNWFIYTGKNEWQQNLNTTEYKKLSEVNNNLLTSEIFLKMPFIKISIKLSLHEWDKAYEFFMNNYAFILRMLNH
jgi:hypothetical protein